VRIPNQEHLAIPWRIHELVTDFELEDAWALPAVSGAREDFGGYLRLVTSDDPAGSGEPLARALWIARDLLGRWLGIGEVTSAAEPVPAGELPFPGSIAARLPADLAGTVGSTRFGSTPFVPVYRTDTEFAAEVSNRTVHAVLHLGWRQAASGEYSPQMAVYVKPRGLLGRAYMQFIKPFRYLIVYPAMERAAAKRWQARDVAGL
jgi:hypothetical protein